MQKAQQLSCCSKLDSELLQVLASARKQQKASSWRHCKIACQDTHSSVLSTYLTVSLSSLSHTHRNMAEMSPQCKHTHPNKHST